MARIERRTQIRWDARSRDPSGAQLVGVFPRTVEAERYLTTVAAHYLAADTTRVVKRSRLDGPSLSILGHHQIGGIRPSTIAAAVASWANEERVGWAAMANNTAKIISDVYRVCTETAPSGP